MKRCSILLLIRKIQNKIFFFSFQDFLNFGFVCLFVYLFIFAVLGLCFCARAFSSCGKWGPLFIAVRRPLTVAASLVAQHRLQTHRLSSCGSWAQLLRGMWDPPGPGLEPVSPALAGRLSTTAPPGKPQNQFFNECHCKNFQNIKNWNWGIIVVTFWRYAWWLRSMREVSELLVMFCSWIWILGTWVCFLFEI